MFRYILVFLLINTCSRSLGVPMRPNASNTSLSNSLTALSSRCESQVLSNLIKSKIDECSVTVPPYNQKQFECLIFLDINNQLCDAVAASKLLVSEEHTAKINEPFDIVKFCSISAKWNVTNLIEFPIYKSTVEKVFSSQIACTKVCSDIDDLTGQDTNFYCKYYKWGSEMLNRQASATPLEGNDFSVMSASQRHNNVKIQPVATDTASLPAFKSNEINAKDKPKDLPVAIPTADKVDVALKSESTSITSSTKKLVPVAENVEEPENIGLNTEAKIFKPEVERPILPVSSGTSEVGTVKTSAADIPLAKTDDVRTVKKPIDILASDKESVLEKSKVQNADPDEYQDSEEGKEGLPDMQGGDDVDDPMLSDLESKKDKELFKGDAKINDAKISSRFTNMADDRQFFSNAMQEGFMDSYDDDDHFFLFFLTAVILVVLLYVLYHNKNKVSKVFLGLIVEGRQPGRRRNSRGHAYRRLETLEQAIGNNASAPPSKIIY